MPLANSFRVAILFTSSSLAAGQGADICANADVIQSCATPIPFDTSNCSDTGAPATSTSPSTCQTTNDVWFAFTPSVSAMHQIDLCFSQFDVELTLFEGDCSALTQLDCNDDFCNIWSGLTSQLTEGTTYRINVGYWSSTAAEWGSGVININALNAPVSCELTTQFAGNNWGSAGGSMYFDLTATSVVSVDALEMNYEPGTAPTAAPVGVEVWMSTNTSYVGNVGGGSPGPGWVFVASDDGTALATGIADVPAILNLSNEWTIPVGTHAVTLIAIGAANLYTNGNGNNQQFTGGALATSHGAADNIPWSGGAFTPRVWNGSLCRRQGLQGSSYCGPAVSNSTGVGAILQAEGELSVAANDLTLVASNLPLNQFGYFLNSLAQGFAAGPGGSQGNLCLGGAIGRYSANVMGSSLSGSISLALDLAATPTPTGPVAIAAGQRWFFQCWYRDVNPGATNNFTDALCITFQ